MIDWDGSRNLGGSTGCKIHDIFVTNFGTLYSISPNGVTYNADILLFEDIRFGDGRVGFETGQAQEKGNIIRGIYSWGAIHTLISIGQVGKRQAGNYTIDGGNIAGGCIRLFNIREAGWYPTSISNLFSESLVMIGSISCGDSQNNIPTKITSCIFHFVQAGAQNLLTVNSPFINFDNCLFRYYDGSKSPLKMYGYATFQNCSFSGLIDNPLNGFIFK